MERYTAFISYRHKPTDMAVAARLHRLLEHYKIPQALRKGGKKTLGKVFRDRDELSLDSNLTQRLRDALDASDYLIVICTPDTPDSPWVTEEITYFLKNHAEDRVFTVLADGDPERSFPAALTQEFDADGNVIHGRTHEPLAANAAADTDRERLRKLDDEFLRLVAPILGCTYDELYQREKRYRRRRRISALCSVAAVIALFAATLAITNAQIKKQALEAQLNRASSLAKMSLNELQDGDALQALKTAYSAVPEDGDLSALPDLQNALAEALYAYQPMEYRADIRVELWGPADQAVFSPDGSLLAAMDTNHVFYMINAHTGAILWTVSDIPDSYLNEFQLGFFADGSAAVCANLEFAAVYDTETGACLRTVRYADLNPDSGEEHFYNTLSPDGYTLALKNQYKGEGSSVVLLDLRTGSRIGKHLLKEDYLGWVEIAFSDDGNHLYALYYKENEDKSCTYFLQMIDVASCTLIRENSFVNDVGRYSYEWLLPVRFPDRAGVYVVLRDQLTVKRTNRFAFIFDDDKDWTRMLELPVDLIGDAQLYAVPQKDRYYGDCIFTYLGQYLLRFPLSGTSFEVNDLLSGKAVGAFKAGENAINLILSDGKMLLFRNSFDKTRSGRVSVLTMNEIETVFGPTAYGAPFAIVSNNANDGGSKRTLQIYRVEGDNLVRGLPAPLIPEEALDGYGADLYPLPDGKSLLHMYYRVKTQLDQQGYAWASMEYYGTVYRDGRIAETFHIPMTEDGIVPMVTGFSPDGRIIYFNSQVYNIETGELTVFNDGRMDRSSRGLCSCAPADEGARMLYAALKENTLFWWYNGDKAHEIPLPDGSYAAFPYEQGVPENNRLLAVGGNGVIAVPFRTDETDDPGMDGILLYSVESGKWLQFRSGSGGESPVPFALAEKTALLAVAAPDGFVRMYDMKHTDAVREFPIDIPFSMIDSMKFIMDDGVLYLRQNNGRKWLLNAEDGAILYQTDCGGKAVQWDPEKNMLFFTGASNLNDTGEAVDTETWTLLYEIPEFCAYLENTGEVLLYDREKISAAELYDSGALLAMAEKKLAAHGIDPQAQ